MTGTQQNKSLKKSRSSKTLEEIKEDKDNDTHQIDPIVVIGTLVVSVISQLNSLSTMPIDPTFSNYKFLHSLDWNNSMSAIIYTCYIVNYVLSMNKEINIKEDAKRLAMVNLYGPVVKWLNGRNFTLNYGSETSIIVHGLKTSIIESNVATQMNKIGEDLEGVASLINVAMLMFKESINLREALLPDPIKSTCCCGWF